jgi:hypothetical protein
MDRIPGPQHPLHSGIASAAEVLRSKGYEGTIRNEMEWSHLFRCDVGWKKNIISRGRVDYSRVIDLSPMP